MIGLAMNGFATWLMGDKTYRTITWFPSAINLTQFL
jgi:hypothetical protein